MNFCKSSIVCLQRSILFGGWLVLVVTFGILGVRLFVTNSSSNIDSGITYTPMDSSIFPDTIDQSAPLSPNSNIQMPDYTNDPCIIMSVKGLAKTGTHWLETTLKLIKSMTCYTASDNINNTTTTNDNKKSLFCSKSKVITNGKHDMTSFLKREFNLKGVRPPVR